MSLSVVAPWFLCLERRRVGGRTPAVTVPQRTSIFTRLLRHPAPTPEAIAAGVARVLRRHEESWIDHWHKATGKFPPRRSQPDTS